MKNLMYLIIFTFLLSCSNDNETDEFNESLSKQEIEDFQQLAG